MFEQAGQPLDRYQLGAFRGTGHNFRDSVSSRSASNRFAADCITLTKLVLVMELQ